MNSFDYTPLEHPAADIRLLKCAEAIGSHGLLCFQLSVWPIDSAPQYAAISYTWGDLVFTKIEIDGCELEVRRNCYDALVQCLGHDHTAYIWIDSICINQQDVSEKSHQVARMHAIYASARQVLACVGPHDDASQFLARVCSTIGSRALGGYLDEDEVQDVVTELAHEWTGLTRDEIASRIQRSFIGFAQRPYWTRLWIVQEVVAGADNLFVLCGTDTIAWEILTSIEGILWVLLETGGHDLRNPLSQLMQLSSEILSSEGTVPLRDLMIQLDDAKCADCRDRIYGLLALINWEDSGLEPIVPDYGRSAWDIALKLLPSLSPYDCPYVMGRLQIDNAVDRMRMLIRERQVRHNAARDSSPTRVFDFQRMVFFRLLEERPGIFHMAQELRGQPACADPTKYLNAVGLTDSRKELEHSDTDTRIPRKVYLGKQLIALVSSEAIPGDLVSFSPFRGTGRCLVLRKADHQNLNVVGTGDLLLESIDYFRELAHIGTIPAMKNNSPLEDAIFQAELRLSAVSEDIMLFFHQDGLGDFNAFYRQFLAIQPVKSGEGAAEIVQWQPRQGSEAYWKLNKEIKKIKMERMKVKLSEPWASTAILIDEYTRTNVWLIVVFRGVEFTIEAARAPVVAQCDQYDREVEVINDPGTHGRDAVFAAYKSLRENVLELFADQLRALAPEPRERRTLQDAAHCVKYTLLRDRYGHAKMEPQVHGPSYLLRPLERATLDVDETIKCINAADILPLDSSTSLAALKGEALLNCQSGARKVFLRLATNGYSEVFKRELSCLVTLSVGGAKAQRLQIPEFIGIVTSDDGGSVVGLITEWIDGSALAEVGNPRKKENRPRWREEVHQTVSFLHDRDIIWGGVDATNVVIDRANKAWVVGFSGGLATAVRMEPTPDNKRREVKAVENMFED